MVDFSGADLRGSKFKNARIIEGGIGEELIFCVDMANAEDIFGEALSRAKTLYKAELDELVQDKIKEKYPHLLEK